MQCLPRWYLAYVSQPWRQVHESLNQDPRRTPTHPRPPGGMSDCGSTIERLGNVPLVRGRDIANLFEVLKYLFRVSVSAQTFALGQL